MDALPRPPKRISRINLRYRHLAEPVSKEEESVQERESVIGEEEKEPQLINADEPLLIREQKGRAVMGRAHRMFHRRQVSKAPSNVLTIIVDVIATVDSAGNIIAQETITPTAAVPSVPSVPAVPPFPSGLTVPQVPAVPTVPIPSVPPYPFGSTGSQLTISSLLPSGSTSGAPTIATPFALNSTKTSFISTSTFLSTSAFNSTSHSSSRLSSSSSQSSSSSTRVSSSFSSTPSATIPSTTNPVGGGGGGPAATAPAPAASSPAASNSQNGNSTPLATPQVVGTVVGSLAGAALILVLLLFLIKRHKQKQRIAGLSLPGNDAADSQPIASSGQQMATTSNPTRGSFAAGGAAAFFNRFSGASRSTADTSTTGEKGFQRISGRKLPSAFSEGMTSEQFAREGTLSGSSFYKDESGFYGGPGIAAAAASKEFDKETGEPSGPGAVGAKERIMPSPARTPVIHHPDDAPPFGASRNGGGSTLSPPHTPNPDVPLRGTLGRSHPSHDGSRGSRFTEDV